MMTVETADAFLDLAVRSGLLSPETLAPYYAAEPPGNPTDPPARRLAGLLVREGLLTAFQATQLIRGRHRGFFLTEKYKLLDLLGVGGMGKVFLCEHLLLQRLVAVKILSGAGESAPAPGAVERFYREARAVAALDSAYVVKVHDVDAARGQPFMVMEYVDGADLHRITTAVGPLPVGTAAEYTRQAALGLAAAHAAGLVHRDVKPGNILADRTGAVKLLDLGLARFFDDAGRNQNLTARFDSEGVLGTADFISPEQITSTSAADIRSDLYSLGCTLYFLLIGKGIFDEGSATQKLMWHQFREPPPVTARGDVPDGLAAVVNRLLAKKPADRYQTPVEVAEALTPFAAARSAPPPPSVLPKVRPESYRLGLSRLPPPSGSGLAALESVPHGPAPRTPTAPMSHPPKGSTDGSRTQRTQPIDRPAPEPAPTPTPTAPLPPPRPPARRRWPLAVGVAALVGIAVGLAAAFGPFDREKAGPQLPQPLPQVGPQALQPGPGPTPPVAGGVIKAGGSTFVGPMVARWAELYQAQSGVKIEYDGVGSGKGQEGALTGKYRFGCSEAPLDDAQLAAAKSAGKEVRHIPLVLGAVVPTYNVPGLPPRTRLRFTGGVLADIFLGKIDRWNDPQIGANNPGLKDALPDLPIKVVHRSDKSGTTAIWTDYLSEVSADWRVGPGKGTVVKWPVGEGASGSTGVTDKVNRTTGALGYVELSNAIQDGLPFGEVRNKSGKYIVPSLASVTAAAAGHAERIPDDMRYSLVDSPGDESYPICGTAWAILVFPAGREADQEVLAFLEWAAHAGQAHVTDLRYAPLPAALQLRLDGMFYRLKAKP